MIEPRHIVIAGGGIAALEAVLALHDLGAGKLRLTLVAPGDRVVLKALAVSEPFGGPRAPSRRLAELMARHGGEFVNDSVVSVDVDARLVHCARGPAIGYDSLLLALGARTRSPFEQVQCFDGDTTMFQGLLADIEQGSTCSLAFVVSPGPAWPLPVYELALMTAQAAAEMGAGDVELTIVSPEQSPLAAFGEAASAAVAALLQAAGVRFVGDAAAQVGRGLIWPTRGSEPIAADRIVALAQLDGPRLPGIPHDAAGFIPVDALGRVRGTTDVWAAGDATDLPVKHGSLACQLADVAAASIAAQAGADVTVTPLRPVLRGRLLTGAADRFLLHAGGETPDVVSIQPLWWPPAKVSGRYLAEYFDTDSGQRPQPSHGVDVEIELYVPPSMDVAKLGLDPYSPLGARPRMP